MTDSTNERLPAQNLEAEKALLSGILLDNDILDECTSIVVAEDFYSLAHEKAFRAMSEMIRAGQKCDAITFPEELIRRNWHEHCGGVPFVSELLTIVAHSQHSRYYARIVRSKADLRQAHYVLSQGLKDINAGPEDVSDVVHSVDGNLMKILERSSGVSDIHVSSALMQLFEEIDRRLAAETDVSGLSTGFKAIDQLTTGLHPASLNIVAARPSMGKTALVGNMAYSLAKAGNPVLFISLEQTCGELLERMLSAVAKIDAHGLRTGRISQREHSALVAASDDIARLPLFVDDRSEQTMSQIRSTARRTQRKHGLSAIIVDYIQLVQPDNRNAPREQQVADVSRKLKALAKELSVPVIALAQLNRQVENRQDHTPKLADLRESGSIEQDADVVMFLNRPEKFDAADRPGVAEISVAKNRNGMCGMVELAWQGSWMRFVDSSDSGPHIWTGSL